MQSTSKAFVRGLPEEILNQTLTEKLACRFSTCFGSFWECVLLELNTTYPIIEIELSDSNENIYRATTRLLMKWVQRCGSRATIGVLLKHLMKVEQFGMTEIDWDKIQQILLHDSSADSFEIGLPEEILNYTQTEKLASRFSICFGSFWECFLLEFNTTYPIVEIELFDSKGNIYRATTRHLMKWVQRCVSRPTIGVLLKHLMKVEQFGMTEINWDKIKQILSHDSKLNTTYPIIEIELSDSNENIYRATTRLLMKWVQRCGSRATIGVLLKHLMKVEQFGMTEIDWDKIQQILLHDSSADSFEIGLPEEILNYTQTEKLASRFSICFGSFWECFLLEFNTTYPIIEIELSDSKGNIYRATTRHLMKWVQRCVSRATIGVLLKHLMKVEQFGMTEINWDKIKQILSHDSSK
ncbi:hypothetical protein Btru_073572 [Bulinus truncatus]|nr:hypothetical protein Btru_073572 [Bulinus truncatus]